MLTSCGDDEPDVPETPTPTNPDDEQLIIDEESLIGTWRYSASDYINTDYIAFDGHGNGMMANAADQFKNTGYARNGNGVFELVTFKYTIDKNIIYIMPDRNHIKDFTITVFDVRSSSLDLLFDLDIPVRRKKMKLYRDEWEWFTKEGPASVDLTSSFIGTYVVDNDHIHKIQVSKINNYTLKVKDLYMNTEVTGVLFWSDIFGTNADGEITLWKPNENLGVDYYFTSDGKLHSMAGNHYYSGGASKSEGNNSNDNNSDENQLIGTWVGKDYDETYTITLYSTGKAKEVWTDGYNTETLNGTYAYSNGKITSWNMSGGSVLANVLGDCPWTVTFNSANSFTLSSGYNKMKFTKK